MGLGTLIVRNAVYRVLKFFWFVFNFCFGHCPVVIFVHVSLVRSSSRHWSQNTASHVSQRCTVGLLNWKERSRVSPSHLPVVFHPCPGSFPPLLAVIASGLGSPHGSRKQRSHFTSWYTFAHSGDDDACFTPRRASSLSQLGVICFCYFLFVSARVLNKVAHYRTAGHDTGAWCRRHHGCACVVTPKHLLQVGEDLFSI